MSANPEDDVIFEAHLAPRARRRVSGVAMVFALVIDREQLQVMLLGLADDEHDREAFSRLEVATDTAALSIHDDTVEPGTQGSNCPDPQRWPPVAANLTQLLRRE